MLEKRQAVTLDSQKTTHKEKERKGRERRKKAKATCKRHSLRHFKHGSNSFCETPFPKIVTDAVKNKNVAKRPDQASSQESCYTQWSNKSLKTSCHKQALK